MKKLFLFAILMLMHFVSIGQTIDPQHCRGEMIVESKMINDTLIITIVSLHREWVQIGEYNGQDCVKHVRREYYLIEDHWSQTGTVEPMKVVPEKYRFDNQ